MHELAVELVVEAAAAAADIETVSARFPTATAAVYQIDGVGRASLDGVFLAKDLGGEGDG
jgi:hypothetical protein